MRESMIHVSLFVIVFCTRLCVGAGDTATLSMSDPEIRSSASTYLPINDDSSRWISTTTTGLPGESPSIESLTESTFVEPSTTEQLRASTSVEEPTTELLTSGTSVYQSATEHLTSGTSVQQSITELLTSGTSVEQPTTELLTSGTPVEQPTTELLTSGTSVDRSITEPVIDRTSADRLSSSNVPVIGTTTTGAESLVGLATNSNVSPSTTSPSLTSPSTTTADDTPSPTVNSADSTDTEVESTILPSPVTDTEVRSEGMQTSTILPSPVTISSGYSTDIKASSPGLDSTPDNGESSTPTTSARSETTTVETSQIQMDPMSSAIPVSATSSSQNVRSTASIETDSLSSESMSPNVGLSTSISSSETEHSPRGAISTLPVLIDPSEAETAAITASTTKLETTDSNNDVASKTASTADKGSTGSRTSIFSSSSSLEVTDAVMSRSSVLQPEESSAMEVEPSIAFGTTISDVTTGIADTVGTAAPVWYDEVLDFLTDRWYIVVAAGAGFIILIIIICWCCCRKKRNQEESNYEIYSSDMYGDTFHNRRNINKPERFSQSNWLAEDTMMMMTETDDKSMDEQDSPMERITSFNNTAMQMDETETDTVDVISNPASPANWTTFGNTFGQGSTFRKPEHPGSRAPNKLTYESAAVTISNPTEGIQLRLQNTTASQQPELQPDPKAPQITANETQDTENNSKSISVNLSPSAEKPSSNVSQQPATSDISTAAEQTPNNSVTGVTVTNANRVSIGKSTGDDTPPRKKRISQKPNQPPPRPPSIMANGNGSIRSSLSPPPPPPPLQEGVNNAGSSSKADSNVPPPPPNLLDQEGQSPLPAPPTLLDQDANTPPAPPPILDQEGENTPPTPPPSLEQTDSNTQSNKKTSDEVLLRSSVEGHPASQVEETSSTQPSPTEASKAQTEL